MLLCFVKGKRAVWNKVKTYGLSLITEDGLYYLVDPITGEKVIIIGEIVVYDSEIKEISEKEKASASTEKPKLPVKEEKTPPENIIPQYNHKYIVETIEQDKEYIITVVIDEEYLKSEDTVYPVIIDPSFTVNYNGIEDATIYSNYFQNVGSSGSLYVGNYNARYGGTMGIARVLVKFPGLMSNPTFHSL